jgi:tetratricopeptide (TPR) repeat protein
MRTWIYRIGALAFLIAPLLLLTPRALAQTGKLTGQVFDLQGKPFPDVVVTITSKDTGTSYTVKTDKDGKFIQLGMQFGTYSVDFKNTSSTPALHYTLGGINVPGQSAPLVVNFKEIAAKSGYDPEAAAKREAAEKKFNDMKTHFNNGRTALTDSDAIKQQLETASADQLAALLAKRSTDLTTAISEFQQAQQGVQPTDKNLPVILDNLGASYAGAGEVDRMMLRTAAADQHQTLQAKVASDYQQAADTLQKAIAAAPTAGRYMDMGTDLAYAGKIPDATAACDKAAALEPSNTAASGGCYKNIGIVLTNAGNMQDAVAPLQKATQVNPKDAQTWLLLGNAMMATISTKQEGGKMIYIIPPGLAEAYQKCVQLDPNGPNGAQAKQNLDSLAQLNGGQSTKVTKKKNN